MELEILTFEDGFWSDKRKSSEIIKSMNFEKNIVSRYEKLATEIDDEEVLIDFLFSKSKRPPDIFSFFFHF